MARLPSSADLGGPSFSGGRAIARVDNSGYVEGARDLARGVANLGIGIREHEEARERAEVARAKSKFLIGKIELDQQFGRESRYQGLKDDYSKKLRELADNTLSSIPGERGRSAFRQEVDVIAAKGLADMDEKQWSNERDALLAETSTDLDSLRNAGLNSADPVMRASVVQTARDRINSLAERGFISQQEAAKKNREWAESYATASVEAMPLDERLTLLRKAPANTGSVLDRIRQIESGGNADAKAEDSSALGQYQFTKGTWIEMVRKHRPELLKSLSEAEIQELRRDPDLSREMAEHLLADNSAALDKAGIPVTPATQYLAHFLGAGDAIKVLKADPGTPLKGLVSDASIKANASILQGRTAGSIAKWASDKMGSGEQTGTVVDFLPADKRFELLDRAEKEYQGLQKEAAAIAKAEYQTYKDGFELRIATGDLTDQDSILSDSTLNDGDKASLIRSLKTETEKQRQLREDAAALSDGTLTLNPVDTDDKKRGNKLYEDLIGKVPQEQQDAFTTAFIQQTGYVPRSVAARIRNGLSGKSTSDVAVALAEAANLYERVPSAVDHMDGGKEIRDAASAFRHLTVNRGMAAEDAAKQFMASRDPERQRTVSALKDAADAFVKERDLSEITDEYDGWGWGDPDGGFTPELTEAMLADYREIAREKFYGPAKGDAEIAKGMALGEIGQLYGRTEVTGSSFVMKYPLERYYPKIEGSHEYAYKAFQEDLKEAANGREVTAVELKATPQTVREIREGRLPTYRLWFQTEENGQRIWQEAFKDGRPQGFGFTQEQILKLQKEAEERRMAPIREMRDLQRSFIENDERRLRERPADPYQQLQIELQGMQ